MYMGARVCIWERLLWSELGVEEYSQEPGEGFGCPKLEFQMAVSSLSAGERTWALGLQQSPLTAFLRPIFPFEITHNLPLLSFIPFNVFSIFSFEYSLHSLQTTRTIEGM